jgi:Arm DNA-binding domain
VITLGCFGQTGLHPTADAPATPPTGVKTPEKPNGCTPTRLGLTHPARPLYSARFATAASRPRSRCPCGGIGRRARLKIEFRKECWFDSGQGHQPTVRCHSPTFTFLNRRKDYKRSDSGGLFMLITTTRLKLWPYAYNFDSKQKLLALGQYPVISLADARIKRDDAKKLLSEGIDPSVNRKEERRNARMARANTFEAVAKELMDKFEAEGDAPKTLKNKQ